MKRIRIVSPKRFAISIGVLLLAILLVFFGVKLIKNLTKDPIIAQIEQSENSKITLITITLKAYSGNEEIPVTGGKLLQGSKVNFAAVYQYKLPNGAIKTLPITQGVTLTNETAADESGYVTLGEGFATVGNGISSQFIVKIKASYKKISETFTFTIPADAIELPGTE